MRTHDWCAALIAAMALVAAPASAAPRVHLAQGDLAGVSAAGADSFKAIPFAAPPIGDLRWRPPASGPRWAGVRDASKYGPACMQRMREGRTLEISEDCLTLNVWTPAGRKPGARAPVMVWIYGGGFVTGANSISAYDGTRYAQHGVVLVAINYRLGRFGFFAHPALDGGAEPVANYGLMDQIAALRWVRDNIAAFGGDPANVTIFGESAGGMSVNALLASPAARGLFHKAIAESSFARGKNPTLPDAEQNGRRFAAAQGVTGDGADAAAALRKLAAEAINAPYGGGERSGPMIDGRILTQSPIEAFAKGEQAHVPYIIGGNSNEAGGRPDTPKDPEAAMARFGPDRDKVVALYGGGDLRRIAAAAATDTMVGEPDRYMARRMQAAGAPAFVYHFSYVPPSMRAAACGAFHGAEVSYVFDNLPTEAVSAAGYSAPAAGPEDRAISTAMIAYWSAFAKTGDPGSAGGPRWPRISDGTLEFGIDGVQARPAFHKDRLDWAEQVAQRPN